MRQIDIIKSTLSAESLTPNKALGQNFLADENAIAEIIAAADAAGKLVVEIGPGLGALTRPLCDAASRVLAVEKDAKMADALAKNLPRENISVVNRDFLDCDLTELTGRAPYIAVGNLPYYATTPIVEKLLMHSPLTITLMVQAEAAERFFAAPGNRVYGPVAVLSQTLYTPMRILDVPRSCFYPEPAVDSAVVRITRSMDEKVDGAAFLRYCKRAFAMRRKTMRNNMLAHHSGFDEALMQLGLPASVRAEAIPPATLYRLYTMYAAGAKA